MYIDSKHCGLFRSTQKIGTFSFAIEGVRVTFDEEGACSLPPSVPGMQPLDSDQDDLHSFFQSLGITWKPLQSEKRHLMSLKIVQRCVTGPGKSWS